MKRLGWGLGVVLSIAAIAVARTPETTVAATVMQTASNTVALASVSTNTTAINAKFAGGYFASSNNALWFVYTNKYTLVCTNSF